MKQFSRRLFLVAGTLGVFAAIRPALAATPVFYRNAGCGCCHVWSERMREAGLEVAMQDSDELGALSERLGVPASLQGCHVGEIDGFVFSGHVPPQDIKRLLAERPVARGLAVPGMPMGSPGMEGGGQSEPYDVLLLGMDGSTTVFASHV